MTAKEFTAALRRRDRLFGTLIVSTSPAWPKVMHMIGLDWVFIDTEHIAISRSELSWMCRAYGAMGLPPVVRIPAPDPYQVTMALDDAAAGVMVPYIESAEQARARWRDEVSTLQGAEAPIDAERRGATRRRAGRLHGEA